MTDLHQRNGDTKESIDYVLLILVLLLVVFGLVVLYSTSAYNGRVKFADPAYYLRKQFFATSIGLFSMYLVSCMDYRRLQNYAWIGYGIALMLSTAVLVVGREYHSLTLRTLQRRISKCLVALLGLYRSDKRQVYRSKSS